MKKSMWLAICLLSALAACTAKSAAAKAREMAGAYAEVVGRYDRLSSRLDEKLRSTADARAVDRLLSETSAMMAARRQELEKLLDRFRGGAASDSLDLVRSKVLIEVGRIDEATRILERLSAGGAGVAGEARLQQAALHLIHRRFDQAAALLKAVEPQVLDQAQFYDLCLALAFSHPDAAAREEFTLKILRSAALPAKLRPMLPRLHANLARLASEGGRLGEARASLDRALALESDPAARAVMENDLRQLALLRQPAPPLTAESWLNSPPLALSGLRGRVVVIDFWAPWCQPCRSVMPALQRLYQKSREKGLMVIGYTRLYGRFSDELEKRERVAAAEELELIKRFVERGKISYPVAVSSEGTGFDAYAVKTIPTLVVVDRRGEVAYLRTGAGDMGRLEEKISSLLAEK